MNVERFLERTFLDSFKCAHNDREFSRDTFKEPCAFQSYYLLTTFPRLEVFYPAQYPTLTMITHANKT